MTSDQIFKQLDIEDSDNTFKAQILSGIMATADLRFSRIVDDIMTDEERREFDDFSKGKQPQDIARWVEEKYEGIGGVYEAIIESIVADLESKSSPGS